MKKSKAKSKNGHGGARPGAGRRWRWKHQPVKMVRLPVVSDETFRELEAFGNFLMFPPMFNQRRGEAQSRGKSKIRDELGSQPS